MKPVIFAGATWDTITIRIKASAGYRQYGFVAEVVTVPISGLGRPDFGLFLVFILQPIRK